MNNDWRDLAKPASYPPRVQQCDTTSSAVRCSLPELHRGECVFPGTAPKPPPPPKRVKGDREKRADEGYQLIPAPPGRSYGWAHEATVELASMTYEAVGFRLVLPLPPSKNDVTRSRAIKRSADGRLMAVQYETTLSKDYKALIAQLFAGFPKWPKPIMLLAAWTVVHARAGSDLLNRPTTGFDALQGVAYDNDTQIAQIGPSKREVGEWPRWELFLAPSKFDAYGALL